VVCGDSEAAVIPSNLPEMSAVINRHTYTLNCKSGSVHVPKEPKQDFARPLRDKNIRNMRLRPRQVLCYRCKQGIHDTPMPGNGGAHKLTSEAKPPDPASHQQTRYETRKHKLETTTHAPPQKVRRLEKTIISKSSPVIKISFAGPRGQGTVVEIPSRPNIPSDYEDGKNQFSGDEEGEAGSSELRHEEHRKMRKAHRKAEKRIKSGSADLNSKHTDAENVADSLSSGVKHKKSKHAKHKLKHKHKHRTSKEHNTGHSESNESFKENSSETTTRKTASEVDGSGNAVDGMMMQTSEVDENEVRCREQSNVIVLSPRHNLMLDCDNVKVGTPTKQYDSNTETSQELDFDFSNINEDFFGSGKSTPNGSDTENNLSDAAPFDVGGISQESLEAGFHGEFAENGSHSPHNFGPLMMKIQSRHINKVMLDDDRIIRSGDVIWGKIHGFPWWPGKVISITESLKDSGVIINQMAQISWFASSTMSHMPCTELYPFLQDFKLRYNKKKKGAYKLAVKQATIAAHSAALDLQKKTPELSEPIDVDVLDS